MNNRSQNGRRATALGLMLLCLLAMLGATARRPTYDAKAVYANAEKAVFYVRALDKQGKLKTAGSGFCVTRDGLAFTAAHVVRDADAVSVALSSGKLLSGVEVLLEDDYFDIALLRLPKSQSGYDFLEVDTETPVSGEAVYAIGYPLRTVKVINSGIVSAPEAPVNSVSRLLISADLASGMSGGPIVCEHGKVVGLASATLRTMNGISTSPSTAQLREVLAAALSDKTA